MPERWLDERVRLGLDRFDEVWEGVLYAPPAPGRLHQRLGTKLVAFLEPLLNQRGVEVQYETEVHRPGSGGQDYRIPDLVFFREDQPSLTLTERGLEGGPLAVLGILSKDDETYEKLGFYAALGIREVIVLKPDTREVEIFRLAGSAYVAVSADASGAVHAASIDVRFSTVPGTPLLARVECRGSAREI
jgi:Uma2 family endonuclease